MQPIHISAELERILTGHLGWVNDVAVNPGGNWLVSCGDDFTVRTWDIDTGAPRATLTGHTERVTRLAMMPGGNTVFSGSYDATIRHWQIDTGKEIAKMGGVLRDFPFDLSLSADARTLISCTGNEEFLLWDTHTHRLQKDIPYKYDAVSNGEFINAIAAGATPGTLVAGGDDGRLMLWDMARGKCQVVIKGGATDVGRVLVTPDGRWAVTGSYDGAVKIWDIVSKTCEMTLTGHNDSVDAIALHPAGRLVASTGFTDNTVRLWDLINGDHLQVITTEKGAWPISVCFSPDGTRLVVGAATGAIYIYRLGE